MNNSHQEFLDAMIIIICLIFLGLCVMLELKALMN